MNTSLPARPKFLTLSTKRQHKMAADALRAAFDTGSWEPYRAIASHLSLSAHLPDFEAIADRYHEHLRQAGLAAREHNLLSRHTDAPSGAPFLPIAIYLENLRSAHNVGSIFRTTEALRFGTLHLSPTTPTPDNKKVRDASMGTCDIVPYTVSALEELHGPLIALETTADAVDIQQFAFPDSFTLLLGNEEYGLSAKALSRADYTVSIPLRGMKNSLNVANAYAIAATYAAAAALGKTTRSL